jgi:hypothetical protein
MSVKLRKVVAVYEILTFVAALANVAATLVMVTDVPPVLYIVGALALLVAGVSLIAGIRLWQDRSGAYRLSFWVQAVQVPHLMIGGIFGYGLGLGLSIVIGLGAKSAGLEQPVHFVATAGSSAEGFYVGVNVLALTAATILARVRKARNDSSGLSAQAV